VFVFLGVLFSYSRRLQGSEATRIRCGGIFNNHFVAKFSRNLSVKKCRKLVKV